MKTDYGVQTPVAFLVFNRPDTTARVFAEIAKARPKKLLVVADGPRPGHSGDSERCAAVRSIIDKVDWDCEVLKNYSDINLGCKERVSSGLDWVFGTVDRAIVLEDDILPDPTFFRFCDELLERFAEDERVGLICGHNVQDGILRSSYSYYFSHYNDVWGWASWARGWKNYDSGMRLWPIIREQGYLKGLLPRSQSVKHWTNIFQDVYDDKIDTWAWRWKFACWVNNMLAVVPQVNLVSNIGFGPQATHTLDPSHKEVERRRECMRFPLVDPDFVVTNWSADAYTEATHYCISPHFNEDCDRCYYGKMREFYHSNKRLSRIRNLVRMTRHGQFGLIFDKIRNRLWPGRRKAH